MNEKKLIYKVEDIVSDEEMNRLIAEFMNVKIRFVEYPNSQLNRWEMDNGSSWTPMLYHCSWNWLIPVIEKISSLNHKVIIGSGDSWGNYCNIKYSTSFNESKRLLLSDGDTKAMGRSEYLIEACYLAIVEFIKWYNNSKQQS